MSTRRTLALAVMVVVMAAIVTPAQAQQQFQYVVKFVCGKGDGRVVAQGTYFTAINVHNPNREGFAFRKKFAVALPEQRVGPISKWIDTKLGPDEAYEIDCPDIIRHFDQPSFLKGFAVIETTWPLDIVAVYTAAGETGVVESIDVEQVKANRMDGGTGGLPDLLPIPDPKLGFCKRDGLKLLVTIKNQGTANAGASSTRVDFSNGVSQTQPTPPIPAGGTVTIGFDIPPGCFSPDCFFRITADSGTVVVESDETNNTASGGCLG